jgi:hypothetical protein
MQNFVLFISDLGPRYFHDKTPTAAIHVVNYTAVETFSYTRL